MSKDTIDYISKQIVKIENTVTSRVKLRQPFLGLQTIPGFGKILSLTIMLETGALDRFAQVGNFSSYCRKVPSACNSNNVKKGKGNSKNGNKYLAWAFSKGAEFAVATIKSSEHITIASPEKPIVWLLTPPWHTSLPELHTTS